MGWFRDILKLDPITYNLGGEKFADNLEQKGLLHATNRALADVDPFSEFVAKNVGQGLGYRGSEDFVRGWGEPVGNAAGAIFAGGTPIGSLAMAADDYSRGKDPSGHLTNAALAYAGSQALSGLGSTGSTAADGASGGLAATEGTSALASTGGEAAGAVSGSTAPAATFDASNFATSNNFGQAPVSDLGYSGMNSISGSPASSQFMTLPASEYAAYGGAGQSLGTTTAEASNLARSGLLSNNSMNFGKLAQEAGSMYAQQAKKEEEEKQKRLMMRQMEARAAMGSAPMESGNTRPAQSFQTLSPYASFSGGYRPVGYGANVRKQNYGLLG